MRKPTIKTVLYNALLFALLGGLWILLTDRMLLYFVSDPWKITLFQTYKGFAFVAVSAVFLYFVGRRDLMAIESYEETLQKERSLMEQVMVTSPVGITVVNLEGRIIFANYWAEQVLGLTRDEITKRAYNAPEWHITDYEGNAISDKKLPFNMVLATGRPVRDAHHAIEWPDGRRVLLSVNAAPLRDEVGNIAEVVATVEDITSREIAEEKLRESQERFGTTFEKAAIGRVLMTVEGKFMHVNEAFSRMTGYSKEELLSKKIMDITHPDDRAECQRCLRAIVEGEEDVCHFEKRYICKDGKVIWGILSSFLYRDSRNNPKYFITDIQDITERKRTEEELRFLQGITKAISESEDFDDAVNIAIRKFCETTGWVYGESWVPSPDKSYFEIDRAWYSSIKGLEEFRTKSNGFKFYRDIGIPGRAWASKKPLWVRDLSKDRSFLRSELVEQFGLKAGMGIPIIAGDEVVAVLTFFVFDDKEEDARLIDFISMVAVQLGILFRRKRAEDALRKSESMYRALAEAAQDAIYVISREDRIEYVNNFAAGLFGLKPEKVIGRQREALFSPDESARQKNELKKVFEIGRPLYTEDKIHFLEGEVWMHTSLVPMRNEAGEVVAAMGVSRNVTEHKRVEEELRLLQTLLQDITTAENFKSAVDVSLRKICEATGWAMGEAWIPVSGGSHLECSPVWYGKNGFEGLKKFRKVSEQFRFQPGIGLPGRVWSSKEPAWVTDVTMDASFIRAHDAVEAGFKAAMAIPVLSGDVVIAVLDFFVFEPRKEDRKLIELVSTVAAYLGILFQRKQAEEELRKLSYVVEHSPASIFITDAKGDIEYVNPKLIEMTGYSREEVVGKKPDILTLGEAILSDKEWRGGFLNTKKSGEQFWEYSIVSPVRNGKGDIIHFIGVSEDITDRQKLEEQLRHAQKLEAIGQLVGGIAHDFNNILTGIIGFAGIMQMNLKKDDPLMEDVEQILEAAGRGASLTQSLLVFGRKQIIRLAPVSLNEIIGKVDKLLSRLIGEDIELRVVTAKKDLMIMADSMQIEQILMNLATNARDAMSDGGVLTIETSREKLDKEFVKMHGYGEAGDYALISVSDTGMGMDEKTREKIFEPFFTTKEVGKGTGLGLSIVYGIVKQHNGYINVYSEVGKGTTFRIYLPLVKRKAEEIKPGEPVVSVAGTETVLIGEDDATVRKLSKTLLEAFGYTVIEAVDGEDAVEKFMENKDNIQLVILDVMMPRKNGKEAYDHIMKIKPGIKALFMSGYTADDTKHRGILEEGLDFVSKPISPSSFLKKVREVLEK